MGKSINEFELLTEIIKYVIGIIIGVLVTFISQKLQTRFLTGNEKIKISFKIYNKKTEKLNPKDVLFIRSHEDIFKDFYYDRIYINNRTYKEELLNALISGKHVLITGSPLAGKTRLAYEVFKKLKGYYLSIPDEHIKSDVYPYLKAKGKKSIVLFDDLDNYAGNVDLQSILGKMILEGFTIIATCSKGVEEEEKMDNLRKEKYFSKFIDIESITESEKEDLIQKANKSGVHIDDSNFNGTTGSLFLPCRRMKDRFDKYDKAKKDILRAMKKLHIAGVYSVRGEFLKERIKKVCEYEGLKFNGNFDLELKYLEKDCFIKIKNLYTVIIDETYLQNLKGVDEIIYFDSALSIRNIFEELLECLEEDREAKSFMAKRAIIVSSDYNLSSDDIEFFNKIARDYLEELQPREILKEVNLEEAIIINENISNDQIIPLAKAQSFLEKNMVIVALKVTKGNKTRAAKLLGISRKSLFNKLRLHNIGSEKDEEQGT